jgi:hypothetical protein
MLMVAMVAMLTVRLKSAAMEWSNLAPHEMSNATMVMLMVAMVAMLTVRLKSAAMVWSSLALHGMSNVMVVFALMDNHVMLLTLLMSANVRHLDRQQLQLQVQQLRRQ